MNAGTVSANYYRVVRSSSGGTATNRRRKADSRRSSAGTKAPSEETRPGAVGRPQGENDLTALADQKIGELVQPLVCRLEERDRRLRKLLG
jgi:hypothetical protein